MNPGVSAKGGDRYEREYVVYQWLLVLAEQCSSVLWEGEGKDEKGIDLWIRKDGSRIAIQCKTRSGGVWTPTLLAKGSKAEGEPAPSILFSARAQLERKDEERADRYRFTTDQRAPAWHDATLPAPMITDPMDWLAEDDKARAELVRGLGLRPESRADVTRARALLARMEVRVIDERSIVESSQALASQLAPSDHGSSLRTTLLTICDENAFSVEWDAGRLLEACEARGVSLPSNPNQRRIREQITKHTDAFLNQITAARRFVCPARPESDRIVERCAAARDPHPVLVHGGGGSGKSVVIADAIRRMREDGLVVLALRSDDIDDWYCDARLDPAASLARVAADGRGVLVIDQLDQLWTLGQVRHALLTRIEKLLMDAATARLSVVIGCRTVDATHETQLRALLTNASTAPVQEILVGDLPESTVTQNLTALGRSLDDLSLEIRTIAHKAIGLALLVDLLEKGEQPSNITSLFTLAKRWWLSVGGRPGSPADQVLEEIVSFMADNGTFAAPRDRISAPDTCDQLISDGALVPEQSGRKVRPVHQLIADTRLAQRWAESSSGAALVEELGPRNVQSLATCSRLRLAVPLIVENAAGAASLDSLYRSDGVRPLVKHAMLLGLASLDPVPRATVRVVRSWLDDPELRTPVLRTVLSRQPQWITEFADWIHESWPTADSDLRLQLTGLAASIAQSRGNLTAQFLDRWLIEDDAGLMDQLGWVLWHDPRHDTDALFEVRLEHMASCLRHGIKMDPPISWPELIRARPDRASRLLAAVLVREEISSLIGWNGPRWANDLPTPGNDAPHPDHAKFPQWDLLRSWWNRLDLGEGGLADLEGGNGQDDSCVLIRVVDLLALSLATELSAGQTTWSGLLQDLPPSLRPLDRWLLFRVGTGLAPGGEYATEAADAAADWFRSQVDQHQIDIGIDWRNDQTFFAREFLGRISTLVSDEAYRKLESTIRTHRDPWTASDERDRTTYGRSWPSDLGRLAHQLLPALDSDRRSKQTQRDLRVLNRKFGEPGPQDLNALGGSGMLRLPISNEFADRWSASEWKQRLSSAPTDTRIRLKPTGSTATMYNRHMLTQTLHELARHRPDHYAGIGKSFDDTVPASARSALLAGVRATSRPSTLAEDAPWSAADDETVADLAIQAAYLEAPEVARELAWCVSGRADFDWPQPVVDRLAQIAAQCPEPKQEPGNSVPLRETIMNEDAGIAMVALGHLSDEHPERREEILRIAEDLSKLPSSRRKLGCANIAMAIAQAPELKDRALGLLFKVTTDTAVLATVEVLQFLVDLTADSAETPAYRDKARTRIRSLATEDQGEALSSCGRALVQLFAQDALDGQALHQDLARDARIRKAAVRQLSPWLSHPLCPSKILDLTLRLANDPDDDVAGSVALAVAHPHTTVLRRDHKFSRAFLQTRAAGLRPDRLLRAFDRQGSLLPVKGEVLGVIAHLEDPDHSKHREYEVGEACNLLARLLEEAEREANFDIRDEALDAWDRLIGLNVPAAELTLAANITAY